MSERADSFSPVSRIDQVVNQISKRLEQCEKSRPSIVGQFESPLNVTAQRHQRKIDQLKLALRVAEIMEKVASGEPLDPETDFLEVGLVDKLDREKIVFNL